MRGVLNLSRRFPSSSSATGGLNNRTSDRSDDKQEDVPSQQSKSQSAASGHIAFLVQENQDRKRPSLMSRFGKKKDAGNGNGHTEYTMKAASEDTSDAGQAEQKEKEHRKRQEEDDGEPRGIEVGQEYEEKGEEEEEEEGSDALTARTLVPYYLQRLIYPYYEDFYQTPSFDPRLIVQLMSEGFLPIAQRRVLLPKLHKRRCVVQLPRDLHVARSTRKKCRRFVFSVNQAFDGVVKGCHAQHGISWLYPKIVKAFQVIHSRGCEVGMNATLFQEGTLIPTGEVCPVRFYSIEVWNATDNKLVGGELGYTVGSIYTSLTGFAAEDSAGSVQLAALGTLLAKQGFTMWDLGMYMEYKERMGAHNIDRIDFVRKVRRVRVRHSHMVLRCNGRVNCKDIVCGVATQEGQRRGSNVTSLPASGNDAQAEEPASNCGKHNGESVSDNGKISAKSNDDRRKRIKHP